MLLLFLLIVAATTISVVLAVQSGLTQTDDPPAFSTGPDDPMGINPANSDNYISADPVDSPPDTLPPNVMRDAPPPTLLDFRQIPGKPGWYYQGQSNPAPPDPPIPQWLQDQRNEIDRLTAIMYRHYHEFVTIPGFAGCGVGSPNNDPDSGQSCIILRATDPHGEFPTTIEGVPVCIEPAFIATPLVAPVTKD